MTRVEDLADMTLIEEDNKLILTDNGTLVEDPVEDPS